jgi:DNA-directed RNA polymerase specialized sigma24 family protein
MTDEEIIQGIKRGDAEITRRYFYGYCRVAYSVCDRRYGLSGKTDMDFYSLAHDYYMRLLMADWQQLDAKRPEVPLRTWMMGGFRYLVLDKLKTYHTVANEDVNALRFDLPDDHFAEEVREMLEEVIDKSFVGDRMSQGILRMILIGGYKAKEVAAQLGVTPSAVSQRYRKLMDSVIIPYFKHHYESQPMVGGAACFEQSSAADISATEAVYGDFYPVNDAMPAALGPSSILEKLTSRFRKSASKSCAEGATSESSIIHPQSSSPMTPNRITPEFITQLGDNEIFVFGSNLAGMHGGGAAYIALKKFGAKLGQGVGLQGQSYAIPTMQGGVETIAPYVDEFIAFAREHPELHFLVTRIGCGIAGFDADEIAPLFRAAKDMENISLPRDFWNHL